MNISEVIKYVNKTKPLVDQSGVAERDKSMEKMELMERLEIIELQLKDINRKSCCILGAKYDWNN